MPNLSSLINPLVPKQAIKPLQGLMDTPREMDEGGGIGDALGAIPDVARGLWNNPKETLGGFGAGALEGLRGQTSPLNLAALTPWGKMAKGARGLMSLGEEAPVALQGLRGALPALTEQGAGQAASHAARDMVNPTSFSTMDKMFQENNPIFRQMQEAGQFSRGEPASEISGIDWGPGGGSSLDPQGLGLSKAAIPEFNPNMPNVGSQLRPKAPYSTITRQPKPGGVLNDVLERAATKGAVGDTLTPGEGRLMKHYAGLIR